MKQTDQVRDIASKHAFRIVLIVFPREIERIEVHRRIQGDLHEAPPDGLAQVLILVFRIENDDTRPEHHGTQYLQLDRIALSGPGFREYDHIRVLQFETIEEDQGIIMAVDTIQDAITR